MENDNYIIKSAILRYGMLTDSIRSFKYLAQQFLTDVSIAGEHINQLSQSIKFSLGNGGAITVLGLNTEYKMQMCHPKLHKSAFYENFLDSSLFKTTINNNSHVISLTISK